MKLVCDQVTKEFKKVTVLKNVNLTFESGKIYGLYGRNGSGKSVLLKIICGLYSPTSGNVTFDGICYDEKKQFPPNLRALIERPSFFPDISGRENLKLLAAIQNKITDQEIDEALKIVNLFDEKDKRYSKYSLGMKQKLGIAQVIMEAPEIIILDEPFNGVERQTISKLIDYFKKLSKEKKLIIFSTHIKEDLDLLADEVIYIDSGEIVNE